MAPAATRGHGTIGTRSIRAMALRMGAVAATATSLMLGRRMDLPLADQLRKRRRPARDRGCQRPWGRRGSAAGGGRGSDREGRPHSRQRK